MRKKLSGRLQAIVNMVRGNGILADIGCDHAYVPIELVDQGRIRGAVASDVRMGPLEIAEENIRAHGLEEKIAIRHSDGFAAFEPGDADTAVIAGMGGYLICDILRASPDVTGSLSEIVLEPQSDLEAVRRCVLETDFAGQYFQISDEEMVEEDGKFYPVIRWVPGTEPWHALLPEEYRYGPVLLQKRHPVLYQYLQKLQRQYQSVQKELARREQNRLSARISEIEEELRLIDAALKRYE